MNLGNSSSQIKLILFIFMTVLQPPATCKTKKAGIFTGTEFEVMVSSLVLLN